MGSGAEGEGGGGIFLTSTATNESPRHPLSLGWHSVTGGVKGACFREDEEENPTSLT